MVISKITANAIPDYMRNHIIESHLTGCRQLDIAPTMLEMLLYYEYIMLNSLQPSFNHYYVQ